MAEQQIDNTVELYNKLMNGFEPSPYVSTEWEMQDGIYRQYSAYENNTFSSSGTNSSIIAVSL